MRRKTRLFSTIFFLFFCIATRAQVNTKITGTLQSTEGKAVEAATVSLLKHKDSSLVKMALSDKSGNYTFEKIKNGDYIIKTEAVGFATCFSKPFQLADNNTSAAIPLIKLEAGANQLKEVTVVTHRPLIENKIDKTVMNVDASTTNSGLNVLEILEKAPGVSVDNDGNVSLKGKQGVMILVDGKQTYLTGADLANYLKNMPSNQLDQVEIMTQPPAKYDAAGNAGIINLITKKNKVNGFNGTITSSAIFAIYFKNTNNINVNWRHGKINLFGQYGYTDWRGFNDINIKRSLRDTITEPYNRYSYQHTYGKYLDYSHDFKAGFDYFANKTTTYTFSVTGNFDNSSFTSDGLANIYDSSKQFVQYNVANSQTKTPLTNLGFDLNVDKKLDDKGQLLSIDGDYVFYNSHSDQYTNNYLYNADGTPSELPYLLNGDLPSLIDVYSLKADYKKPLKHDASLEAGFKSSYVRTDNNAIYTLFNNDNQKWEPDETLSNHFIYKENINAAYVSFQKKIKKFGMQLGLRAEQTIANGNQVTKSISFNKNYIQLFPTTYFTYNKNDKNTFELSYGRRVDRPDYSMLNPFQFQLDRYTYRQGNPNLQPQFSHNVELSYNYKGQLNITANYTYTTDIINDVLLTVKQPGDSNYTTYQTSENIASNRNIGLAVNYSKQIYKWWTINVYGNVFNNDYKGVIQGEAIHVNIFAFNGNFSSQFNFNKGWGAEASGWYNGKNFVSSAILADPMGMFSLGGSKQVLKGKGSVKVNLRDPFYLAHFNGSTYLSNGLTEIHSKWDNRRYIITLTYRFGKNKPQQAHHGSGAEEEQSRVKTGGGQQ